jgi:subtilisin family serine protease
VIDTGIAGAMKEIAPARRSQLNLPSLFEGQHWLDPQGHGSMCAAIAAGSKADGGKYNGVAPGATVVAARSSLQASDLADIYDEIIRAKAQGRLPGPIVITNSYGLYVCTPPNVLPGNHPYIDTIISAIDQGCFVCFAAGNNHYKEKCNHDPTACGPNSIWGANSHDRIVSVGTVNRDLTNCDPLTPHANSSRGPGEWALNTIKPDCVAPTYGEVPWGATYRRMQWWGTSGACPQVAGLAALILSVSPKLKPSDFGQIIKETCSLLPEGKTCVGHGVINCERAVQAAVQRAGDA